jgi:hypothetical protein
MRSLQAVAMFCIFATSGAWGQQRPAGVPKKPAGSSCGLVYGEDHVVLVCAPDGWVLDNKILADQKIYATFYRKGTTYPEAEKRGTLMYVNVQSKRAGRQTALEMMKLDAEKTKHESPKLVVQREAPILISSSDTQKKARQVPVQTFLNAFGGGYESIAYVEDEHTISLVVLSSASEQLMRRDYPAFVKLVKSYSFVAPGGQAEK